MVTMARLGRAQLVERPAARWAQVLLVLEVPERLVGTVGLESELLA